MRRDKACTPPWHFVRIWLLPEGRPVKATLVCYTGNARETIPCYCWSKHTPSGRPNSSHDRPRRVSSVWIATVQEKRPYPQRQTESSVQGMRTPVCGQGRRPHHCLTSNARWLSTCCASASRCAGSVGLWASVSRGSCTSWSSALQRVPITARPAASQSNRRADSAAGSRSR